ncbi:MAG: hypothetical protein AB7E32_04770 [Desulfovibrio sp.]
MLVAIRISRSCQVYDLKANGRRKSESGFAGTLRFAHGAENPARQDSFFALRKLFQCLVTLFEFSQFACQKQGNGVKPQGFPEPSAGGRRQVLFASDRFDSSACSGSQGHSPNGFGIYDG